MTTSESPLNKMVNMRLSTIWTMLFAALLLVPVLPAQAQEVLDTPNWSVGAGSVDWLTTEHTTRGAAFNPTTGHVLVATRAGGARVIAVDASDGSFVKELNATGISGGTFAINVITVTSDGQIFASNLTTNATTSPLKVYRWADEDAAPVIYYEGAPSVDHRYGDSIGSSGSGDDVEVYVSGGGAPATPNVAILSHDGTEVIATTINVGAGMARGGIAAGTGDALWINQGGNTIKMIDRTPTVLREITGDHAPTAYQLVRYFEIGDRQFVAAGIAIDNQTARIVDVTDETFEHVATTMSLGDDRNVNATGAIAYDADNNQLIVLSTNNSLTAFSLDFLAPEPPPPFEPIAFWHFNDQEITPGVFGYEEGDFPHQADVGTGQITVGGGDILSLDANNRYRWIQSFGGTTLNAPPDVEGGGTIALQGGTDAANNGAWIQLEVNTVGYEDVELSFAARGTNTGFRNNQVSYSTDGQTFTDVGEPFDPADGSNFNVYTFSFDAALNHEATAYIRITFDGATGETGNNRIDNLTVSGTEVEPPTLLDDPEWLIAAGDVAWFANDNNTRSGDYNPSTDHVLVATRTGGPQVLVLHPANGRVIGSLDMTGVAGGTFAINEISVTEDGQIFGANLVIAAGAEVRIYRWADENAAPEVVFAGAIAGPRYGDVLHVSGSGNDVRLFISGSGTDNIAMLEWDGEDFGEPTYIVAEEGVARARLGIAHVPGQDSLWINGAGSELTKIGFDGGIGREVPTDVLPSGFGDLSFFEWNDRSYVLSGPDYGADHSFRVVDVTDPGEERVVFQTMALGTNPNLNGVGFAALDSKRSNIIVGATNNAIASFSLEAHDNQAPTASNILTPADGTEITIEGDGETEFTATWSEATDPDDDTVLYSWQLSASPSFDQLIIDMYVGTETSFTTDFETVAGILDAAGVAVEGSITLYHRVITSDGALVTTGSASTVVLTRGTLTNVDENLGLPTEFALHGNYPNPFNPTTSIRFDLPQAADVQIQVYDVLGRQVMTMQQTGMQAGANQTLMIDASRLASGTYLYRVVVEMQGTQRVETGKMLLVK
jgi:hypothetical protein